jgi:hypothetical protein
MIQISRYSHRSCDRQKKISILLISSNWLWAQSTCKFEPLFLTTPHLVLFLTLSSWTTRPVPILIMSMTPEQMAQAIGQLQQQLQQLATENASFKQQVVSANQSAQATQAHAAQLQAQAANAVAAPASRDPKAPIPTNSMAIRRTFGSLQRKL